MAVFHQIATIISRGAHTCAVATAAYRSGTLLKLNVKHSDTDSIEEYSFDFSNKPGIAFSAIIARENAPQWVFDRQILWQYVEDRDNEFDSNLAVEFTIALPEELNAEQNTKLIKEFVKDSFTAHDLVADVNFHNDHKNNPHVHIMCPLRALEKQADGSINFGAIKVDWNNSAEAEEVRKKQASIINKHLEKCGYQTRISHLPDPTPRFDSFRPWL